MSLALFAALMLQVEPPVTGTVLESGRLEPVRYALVEVVDAARRTLTDEHGVFVLGRLPAGDHVLRVTAPGYRAHEVEIDVGPERGRHMRILLEPDPIAVGGATVVAPRPHGLSHVDAPGGRLVDTLRMNMMPAVVERDLLRAVQHEPSVTPSSDFSTALFVRGGTPDQTRVLLDGTPVHNVFHLGGFVSAFTPSATAAAVLQPGALPASAPSSLSGLLEVHTRDGGRDSVRVAGEVGLLSSALTVDGPLPGGRGAFLVSGRRTYIDFAVETARLLGLTDQRFPYGFSDLMTKLTWSLGAGSALTLSGYLNREGYDADPLDDPPSGGDRDGEAEVGNAEWGNDAVSLRLRALPAAWLQLEAGVGTSGFGADLIEDEAGGDLDRRGLDSSMRTWVADVETRASLGGHLFVTGVRWERTRVDHLFDTHAFDEVPELDIEGAFGSTSLFARDRWRLTDALTVDYGVRLERPRGRAWHVLPRGRLEWAGGERWSWALGAGRYVQDWWSPRNEEGVVAAYAGYDLPAPVAAEHALPTGWDVALEGRVGLRSWALRGDIFMKRIEGVVVSPVALDPKAADYTLDPDSLRLGGSRVEGVELAATGAALGTGLMVSYRWQRERRRLGGESWAPRSERLHRLIVAGARPWGERELAASLTWMSGPPYTPVVGREAAVGGFGPDGRGTGTGISRLVFGDLNSARLPSYLRLDASVRGDWDLTLFGRTGSLEPWVSVLNLIGRTNALYAAPQRGIGGGQVIVERGPQLPVVPSFGLRWRF